MGGWGWEEDVLQIVGDRLTNGGALNSQKVKLDIARVSEQCSEQVGTGR